MGICIQELQMELKVMTERKEKGFSLTTTALSQVEKSNDDDAEMCEKWEKWYKSINIYFCPRVLKQLKSNKTLTLKDLISKELGTGTFNKFLVCQYRMSYNGNTIPNMHTTTISNVHRLWRSICVTVSIVLHWILLNSQKVTYVHSWKYCVEVTFDIVWKYHKKSYFTTFIFKVCKCIWIFAPNINNGTYMQNTYLEKLHEKWVIIGYFQIRCLHVWKKGHNASNAATMAFSW